MKYIASSVIFGRKPRQEGKQFKTAFFKLYTQANPLASDDFPAKEIEFGDIEKVELRNQDVDYYLEGNDLIINNIKAIVIEQTGSVLKVSVER